MGRRSVSERVRGVKTLSKRDVRALTVLSEAQSVASRGSEALRGTSRDVEPEAVARLVRAAAWRKAPDAFDAGWDAGFDAGWAERAAFSGFSAPEGTSRDVVLSRDVALGALEGLLRGMALGVSSEAVRSAAVALESALGGRRKGSL